MIDKNTRKKAIQPEKTAVLCIDMQNGECAKQLRKQFKNEGKDERHLYLFNQLELIVIPNQQKLLKACRKTGIEIIYTTIESLTNNGRERSLDYKISGIHVPKNSWESLVIDEIQPAKDDIILPKTTSSVFNSTIIDYILHNMGIEYLLIFGIITEQCVESSIRDAADKGYLITQIEDCCASYSELTHNQSIEAMKGHYCRTKTTIGMISELNELDSKR